MQLMGIASLNLRARANLILAVAYFALPDFILKRRAV